MTNRTRTFWEVQYNNLQGEAINALKDTNTKMRDLLTEVSKMREHVLELQEENLNLKEIIEQQLRFMVQEKDNEVISNDSTETV